MDKISVLIVDDEKYVLSSFKRLFRDPKYDVYTAATLPEALTVLEQQSIGVIICDYRMENSWGTDILAMIKKRWPDLSRILLTGYFNLDIAQNSLKKGEIYRFITKPWNDDELKITVENSWKRYKLLQSNRKLLKLIQSQNDHLQQATMNLKRAIQKRIEKIMQSKNKIHAKKIQLQITHSIIKGLSRSKSLKEIFKIILKELQRLIPFDDASIIVELNPHTHRFLSQKSLLSGKKLLQAIPLVLKNYPWLEKIFKEKSPQIIRNISLTEKLPGERKTAASHLIFPLLAADLAPSRSMATLNLSSKKKNFFQEDDIKKISDIASSIAIAIEKMKLLEIVEEGSRQWESTFDAISDIVTVIDKNFNLVKANRATENITGENVKKVIGEKCYEVLANRKVPCRNCPAQQTLKSATITAENKIIDFKNRDYLSWAFPMFNAKKGVASMVVYYRDHTKASQLYRQLIQSEKMAAVGQLAGSLAHELNNPLTGITAFAQILKSELGSKNSLYPDVVEIEKASFRCKNIIDNLLNFSEKRNAKKTSVSINDIIEATLPLIQYSSTEKHNVLIHKRLMPNLPKIKGDPNQLQQVFLNLMLNAFQAMPRGGNLMIKTSLLPKQSLIQIIIRDTGVGIPKQNLPKIFDPFYTTKEKTRGTGLGLSVSYGIIRDHQGSIEIQSRLNKGSTFKVILPLERL